MTAAEDEDYQEDLDLFAKDDDNFKVTKRFLCFV